MCWLCVSVVVFFVLSNVFFMSSHERIRRSVRFVVVTASMMTRLQFRFSIGAVVSALFMHTSIVIKRGITIYLRCNLHSVKLGGVVIVITRQITVGIWTYFTGVYVHGMVVVMPRLGLVHGSRRIYDTGWSIELGVCHGDQIKIRSIVFSILRHILAITTNLCSILYNNISIKYQYQL